MSDASDPSNPAATTAAPAEQADMALRRMAMSFCAPLWWESARQVVVRSGTMCVIQTPEAIVGITNDHVLTSYENHKRETPDVFCQLGSAPFDPSANLIERSERWDLATFSIPALTLEHWGHQIYITTRWPPPPITVGEHVVFGGYPEERRTVAAGPFPATMTTDFVTLRQEPYGSSPEQVSFHFDPTQVTWLPNVKAPLPADASSSGISGGPCFRIAASENRIELAGVIYEGDYARGVIWARHLCLISASGRISPIPV
jgi:hypothetical protein